MAVVSRCLQVALLSCAFVSRAHSQDLLIPEIVVTATRTPQATSRAGSAISVITSEAIEKSSAHNIGELLQQIPGIHVSRAGGAGGQELVRIRGGDARHTLVLIDGVRVNDPSSTGREFDFAALVLADVERIEILRGAQSAVYGSDAMGGVVNIILKEGRAGNRLSLDISHGTHGTTELKGAASGEQERFYYSLGFSRLRTDGFSTYGHRIPRLERRLPKLEDDGANRMGLSGRFGVRLSDSMTLEMGGTANASQADYDIAFGDFPDTPSIAHNDLNGGYTRLIDDVFDGALRSTLTVFANRSARTLFDYFVYGPGAQDYQETHYGFKGSRTGVEYQADVRLGSFGHLTLGSRLERETAESTHRSVYPVPGADQQHFKAYQDTSSAFVSYQSTFSERLHMSAGGRVDVVSNVGLFVTGRATVAYETWETGTKWRGSIGTGAKAPSLYQLFSTYGNDGLDPEHSLSVDIGLDQRLFDERLRVSTTLFSNRFNSLIEFTTSQSGCGHGRPYGCYYNIDAAKTYGLEVELEAILNESVSVRGAYTYLRANDLASGDELARRPKHQAFVGLRLTPTQQWTLEPTLVVVGERFSSPGEQERLGPYARLDFLAEYKVDDNFALFARAENLTNAHYQEVRDYGTAGRSVYGGMRITW
jgi:vitamin B12 transporter